LPPVPGAVVHAKEEVALVKGHVTVKVVKALL
jgi:hypothetical protein